VLAEATLALGPRILPILRWIAEHPSRHARGFPDLLVWSREHPRETGRFIEVKAPGDQLRLEQRIAHDELLRSGYDVSIARVIAR
jgi:hypothetical protein